MSVVSASETRTEGNKEISASGRDAFLQGFTDVMLTGEDKTTSTQNVLNNQGSV